MRKAKFSALNAEVERDTKKTLSTGECAMNRGGEIKKT